MKRVEKFWRSSVKHGTKCALVLALGAVFICGSPLGALAAEEESSQSNEAMLGLGSGLLTLAYLPAKIAYAAVGGVIGGFTYALTGGDVETAQSVWEPSFYGTYVITPAHLKGNEPVRFYGTSPYEEEAFLAER